MEHYLSCAAVTKKYLIKYVDLLKAMGSSVVYVGEIGSGNVAKLANQMVVASNIGICAEAMTFAKKMGIRSRSLYIRQSAVDLQVLRLWMQKYL